MEKPNVSEILAAAKAHKEKMEQEAAATAETEKQSTLQSKVDALAENRQRQTEIQNQRKNDAKTLRGVRASLNPLRKETREADTAKKEIEALALPEEDSEGYISQIEQGAAEAQKGIEPLQQQRQEIRTRSKSTKSEMKNLNTEAEQAMQDPEVALQVQAEAMQKHEQDEQQKKDNKEREEHELAEQKEYLESEIEKMSRSINTDNDKIRELEVVQELRNKIDTLNAEHTDWVSENWFENQLRDAREALRRAPKRLGLFKDSKKEKELQDKIASIEAQHDSQRNDIKIYDSKFREYNDQATSLLKKVGPGTLNEVPLLIRRLQTDIKNTKERLELFTKGLDELKSSSNK